MSIQFGMPTLIEYHSLEQSLILCSELRLDFVELNMNLPEFQIDRMDVEHTKQLLKQYGKYLTIHLDENLNVCDFNADVADAYLSTVLRTIAIAKELNSPVINMHLAEGVYFSLPEGRVYLFEKYRETYLERLQYIRDACETAISGSNVLICVENYGAYQDFQQDSIDLLLQSPCFALTYDVGHDFCAGNSNETFILSHVSRLKHMHIHDASGTRDHLILGSGEINILDKLALARKHGCRCVIETKTSDALRQSAAYLNDVLNDGESLQPCGGDIQFSAVTNDSTNDKKLDLFQSLFKGREDVYARRWESKDGQKSGYAPTCRNEWARGICEKPKVKCADCKSRELIPLDRNVIARHLAGKEVIGIYPMLPDENCLFLALDFDEGDWRKDVLALRQVCEKLEIPIAVERSRSGNGAHIWFFFEEAVSAYTARKFGSALLTTAMDAHHKLKFSSYDRLFPNQDTMPKGGFGNLIALPLQREARNKGNSVFVDKRFMPYADQWAFLNGLKRLNVDELNGFVLLLCKDGELGSLHRDSSDEDARDRPWQKKPPKQKLNINDFPSELQIIAANMLYIPKDGISGRALNRLKRLAAFKNPQFYKAQAMRLLTWDKPRVISISDETEKYLCLPRGCREDIEELTGELDIPIKWQDQCNAGRSIDVEFNGVLREEQSEAQAALLAHNNGILSATTAFGKTVVAASLIAERKVNTLILVDKQPLLDQWIARLTEFLSIHETLPELPVKRGRKKSRSIIGILGAGKNSLSGIIDIAIFQSLVYGGEVKDIVRNYGMVIVDECHHVSSVSFEKVLREVNARYVYGLTATPKRQDGHQPIITMHCGQIRYKDDAKLQALKRPFEHFIIPRFTSYRLPVDKIESDIKIQELYSDIWQSEMRNDMIIADVVQAVSEGRHPLVLTGRKSHVELLTKALQERLPNVIALTGGQPTKERKRLLAQVLSTPENQPLVIVATGKYVGEGFDVPRLDTLFLAMPIAWEGTLAQYAGRLHRLHDGKEEVQIYDYIDVHVAVLERMYAKRVKGYSAIGYKAKCEGILPEEGNIIFDDASFLSVFTADLLSAKREIVIVSPFLTKNRVSKMLALLKNCMQSGSKVIVITRPTSDYSEKNIDRISSILKHLSDQGITVIERSKIHQKFAVIDDRIVWYGSINLLSFGSAEESIMRLESASIAGELMGIVK